MHAPVFFLLAVLWCLLSPPHTIAATGPETNATSSSTHPAPAGEDAPTASPGSEQAGQTLLEEAPLPPVPADYGVHMAQAVEALLYPKKAAASPGGAVRNQVWGALFAEVKTRESLPLDEAIEPFILSYALPQQNGSLHLLYIFDEKQHLMDATCFINIPRSTNEAYLEDYDHLVKGFTALYGAPEEPSSVYKGDTKTAAPDNLIEAIESGENKLITSWRVSPTTTMRLIMSGEEAGITLYTRFTPHTTGTTAP